MAEQQHLARRALAGTRCARRDGLADRPARLGQVDDRCRARGAPDQGGPLAYLLDGDNLRHGLCGDLGFSEADRAQNIARAGELARLFADSGAIAIVALVSPVDASRAAVRESHERCGLRFIEVFVDTPLEVCKARDPKALYRRAAAGEIRGFTGVDSPYEPPSRADLTLTDGITVPCAVGAVLELLDGSNGSAGHWGHERIQAAAAAGTGGIRRIHEQNGARK